MTKKRITNAMLAKQIDGLSDSLQVVQNWMSTHEVSDNTRFEESKVAVEQLPTKEDIAKLATKKDVKDVLEVFENIKEAASIIGGGGKWSFKALLAVAAIFTAFAAISIGWSTLMAYFVGTKP